MAKRSTRNSTSQNLTNELVCECVSECVCDHSIVFMYSVHTCLAEAEAVFWGIPISFA